MNVEKDLQKGFPLEIRDEYYCDSQNSSIRFQCKLFNTFKIINSFLNDILLVILNILIDCILLVKFHKYLDKKSVHVVDLDHHKNIQKSKTNINRMIFCNSILYITSHLPEFATVILLIVDSQKISKFCQYNYSCDLISEESEFFGLISIVFQFYIFKIFDKNFKTSFQDLKSRLCQKRSKNTTNPSPSPNLFSNNTELINLKNLIGNGIID